MNEATGALYMHDTLGHYTFLAGLIYKWIRSLLCVQQVRSKTAASHMGSPLHREMQNKCCTWREWGNKIQKVCVSVFLFLFIYFLAAYLPECIASCAAKIMFWSRGKGREGIVHLPWKENQVCLVYFNLSNTILTIFLVSFMKTSQIFDFSVGHLNSNDDIYLISQMNIDANTHNKMISICTTVIMKNIYKFPLLKAHLRCFPSCAGWAKRKSHSDAITSPGSQDTLKRKGGA